MRAPSMSMVSYRLPELARELVHHRELPAVGAGRLQLRRGVQVRQGVEWAEAGAGARPRSRGTCTRRGCRRPRRTSPRRRTCGRRPRRPAGSRPRASCASGASGPVFHMMGTPPCFAMSSTSDLRATSRRRRSWPPGAAEQIAGEEGQHQVGLVAAPALVDDADPVRVAVVGDARRRRPTSRTFGPRGPACSRPSPGPAGDWGSVPSDSQYSSTTSQPRRRSSSGAKSARDPVARVHHDLERPPRASRSGVIVVQVLVARIRVVARARAALEIARLDGGEQPLDLLLGQRRRARRAPS